MILTNFKHIERKKIYVKKLKRNYKFFLETVFVKLLSSYFRKLF